LTPADGCLFVGFAALVGGAYLVFGAGWSLMLGGTLLVLVGVRAYR
jgi:hypothetical protein